MKCDSYPVLRPLYLTPRGEGVEDGGDREGWEKGGGELKRFNAPTVISVCMINFGIF
jgi:hypothetical protein